MQYLKKIQTRLLKHFGKVSATWLASTLLIALIPILGVSERTPDLSLIYDYRLPALEIAELEVYPSFPSELPILERTSSGQVPPPRLISERDRLHGWIIQNRPLPSYFNLVPNLHREEIVCLATNIYYEARSSSVNDQRGVAQVTMNRADHPAFPDRVCEVVWEPYQFSWTHENYRRPYSRDAWSRALVIAWANYYGHDDYIISTDITHYHRFDISPRWTHHARNHRRIGAHVYMQMNTGAR